MSEAIIIALIAAVPPTLVGIVGLIISLRNTTKIDVVKKQNDGMFSQMEAARVASQLKAEAATADASAARAETVSATAATAVATAAGVAAVLESNRTHEASDKAIKEGAQAAVEPIAAEAVAKGAKDAVIEAAANPPK